MCDVNVHVPWIDEGPEAALAGGKEMPGCVGQPVEVAARATVAAAQNMMGADAGGNFQRGNGVTGWSSDAAVSRLEAAVQKRVPSQRSDS